MVNRPLTTKICDTPLDRLHELDVITDQQLKVVMTAAASIFYKERTWRKILEAAALSSKGRSQIGELVRRFRIDQKMLDAVALLKAVGVEDNSSPGEPPDWEFSHTSYFRALTT